MNTRGSIVILTNAYLMAREHALRYHGNEQTSEDETWKCHRHTVKASLPIHVCLPPKVD